MEFPGNSINPRPKDEGPEPPRVKKVVAPGKARTRKKPLGRKFMETFFAGDFESVTHTVIAEVLIPEIKAAITDSIMQTVERMFHGEVRAGGYRRPDPRASGTISYNKVARPAPYHRDEPRRYSADPRRRRHDFEPIVLETKVEAEDVLEELEAISSTYGQVSIYTFHEIVGLPCDHIQQEWGWSASAIEDGDIRRLPRGEGYLIDLPRPEPIEK